MNFCQHKPKNRKWDRPGNEAKEKWCVGVCMHVCGRLTAVG